MLSIQLIFLSRSPPPHCLLHIVQSPDNQREDLLEEEEVGVQTFIFSPWHVLELKTPHPKQRSGSST